MCFLPFNPFESHRSIAGTLVVAMVQAVGRLHHHRQAGNDYEVNVKAELEIELLHQKIDLMREKEIKALTELVRELTQQLNGMNKPAN